MVEAAPIALFFINLFTSHLPETNEIRVHLINSAPYFRFLTIGIVLLIIMRFRPQGIYQKRLLKINVLYTFRNWVRTYILFV